MLLHRDALPVELNVSTCRERKGGAMGVEERKVGGFPDAESKQDLAEAFANLNESARRYCTLFLCALFSLFLSVFSCSFADLRSGRAIPHYPRGLLPFCRGK